MNKYDQNPHRYDDLLKLPYPYPTYRKRMSMSERGAQFAPFAALAGHDASVKETARLTDEKIELSEQTKTMLDLKLNYIQTLLPNCPEVIITYFEKDALKKGGAYKTQPCIIQKINEQKKEIILEDKTKFKIEDILTIESDIFNMFDF